MKQEITKTPRKMGRPPKPGGPLSNAQRQQRWRDKVKADAHELLQQIKAAQ